MGWISKVVNTKVAVGCLYKTTQDGFVEVLELFNFVEDNTIRYRAKVKFLDSGNEYVVSRNALREGKIRDSERDRSHLYLPKFIEVWGDTYDYSETKSKTVTEKVPIKCREHGVFYVTPSNHIKGSGCVHCGQSRYYSTERLKLELSRVLDETQDFSETVYTGAQDKVRIVCKKHGGWFETANAIINAGNRCPSCRVEESRKPFNEFLEKAKETHGSRYTYVESSYVGMSHSLEIICSKHGAFKQRASTHITNRANCPLCAKEERYLSQEQFIEKCKNIHNDWYDYSKVVYKGVRSKVTITCPLHGDFEQEAGAHVVGKGCKYCAPTGYNPDKAAVLYVLDAGEYTKIGITNKDPSYRIKQLNKVSPYKFTLVQHFNFDSGYVCGEIEKQVLSYFRDFYDYPDDKFGGWTECFKNLTPSLAILKIVELMEKNNQ